MKRKKYRICSLLLASAALCAAAIGVLASDSGNYPHVNADGSLDVAAYFHCNDIIFSAGDEFFDFIIDGEDASFTFEQELAADNFSLTFAGAEENAGFEGASFYLTDSEDTSESIKLQYAALSDSMSAFTLNDSHRSYTVSASAFKESDYDIAFNYNKNAGTVEDSVNFSIPITTNADGSAFKGFESGKVKLEVHLQGAKGSFLRLKTINQQRFGNIYNADAVAPMICVGDTPRTVAKDSVITLPTAYAVDVLSTKATVKMTVQSGDGEIVESIDGTRLEGIDPATAYQIKIEKYGIYRLEFIASDGINTTRDIVSRIRVLDGTPPVLKLSGTVSPSVNVGDKITFPQMTATDDNSENVSTWVNVQYPSGKVTCEQSSFVATEEGQYILTFCAMDEDKNIRRVEQKTYAEPKAEEE